MLHCTLNYLGLLSAMFYEINKLINSVRKTQEQTHNWKESIIRLHYNKGNETDTSNVYLYDFLLSKLNPY
jgi:hypothetical protein